MRNYWSQLRSLGQRTVRRRERGAAVVEYALIVAPERDPPADLPAAHAVVVGLRPDRELRALGATSSTSPRVPPLREITPSMPAMEKVNTRSMAL